MTSQGSGVTRRKLLKTTIGLTVGAAAARAAMPARADAGSVSITDGGGAWGAAQRAAYFDPFEKETGIKVTLVPYAMAGKVASSVAAGAPVADVVDLTGSQLPNFDKRGLLTPIDTKYFDPADLAGLDPVKADPYGIPSLFGSIILAYRKDVATASKPTRWADLWNAQAFPGSCTLADGGAMTSAGSTFEIALLADGVAPGNLYPIDWTRAFKSLDGIRPRIAKFWQGFAEPVQLLVDKNVALCSAYNGRVADAQGKGAPIDFSWDQGILGWDYWVVPKGAPNAVNAFKFIAFATRADRQAAFASLIDYAPTNSRAYATLAPDRAMRMPTAPAVRGQQIVTNYGWWAAELSSGVANELLAKQLWEKWLKQG